MDNQLALDKLKEGVKEIYNRSDIILHFHGWDHICFVFDLSLEFAQELNADLFLVSASALTHDLNYLVKIKSKVAEGKDLRYRLLVNAGLTEKNIQDIEKIVNEASISSRNENISLEAKALSDADTLFKALPITPVIFANLYLKEQNISIAELADKIVKEQVTLYEKGFYFYSNGAKAYLDWAKVNIELWKNVKKFFNSDKFSNYFNIYTNYNHG